MTITIETATEINEIKKLITKARQAKLFVSFYGENGLAGKFKLILKNKLTTHVISLLSIDNIPVSVGLCFWKDNPMTYFFTRKAYRQRGYASQIKNEIDKHIPKYNIHLNSEHKGNRIFMQKRFGIK